MRNDIGPRTISAGGRVVYQTSWRKVKHEAAKTPSSQRATHTLNQIALPPSFITSKTQSVARPPPNHLPNREPPFVPFVSLEPLCLTRSYCPSPRGLASHSLKTFSAGFASG